MKKRQIELTIETAERWYNGTDAELKELALQTFPELEKKKLPKSWAELEVSCVLPSIEQMEAADAFVKLSQLREVYRNGWVPDWSDTENKYCIVFYKGKPTSFIFKATGNFLSFQDKKTLDLFLENFRDLIEKAKPLLS